RRRASWRHRPPVARVRLVRHVQELRAPRRGLQEAGGGARLMPRRLTPDVWLFGAAVALLSAGVVMVYSASAVVAADRFHDPYFFLKKQLFCGLLGAGVLLAALRCDLRWLEKVVVPTLMVGGVLLVLVLVPPIGQAINGTRRWIRLGPVSFQPVELAKLALVLYLAAFLAKRRGGLEQFRTGVLPPLLIGGVMAGGGAAAPGPRGLHDARESGAWPRLFAGPPPDAPRR